ncbi:hypothetical protein ELH50_01185 [Rhizobium ruizarguesonis]|uniref:hypothetical protein n=1 Tax=Rhizobium ruizarguesonis TaxID=2081791 RepID=UPI001031D113|nr:hypothetical protein [Rhizobium ruizarguesonis]TBB09812.1 hypothetical protein ELH50_01185 [Rhizobium ruizarguesonis]
MVDVFLSSDGRARDEILTRLPFDRNRSKNPGVTADPKRYRDGRQLLRTIGLIYEDEDKLLRVTPLGRAVERWRPVLSPGNAAVLGRHAAQALAACQLCNPTNEGSRYREEVEVFPFAFIWRAMLLLDDSITSPELNRAIFRVSNEDELFSAVEKIRAYRLSGDLNSLGEEVETSSEKNDRILIWMAWASFGWTLIMDKRETASESYTIAPQARRLIADAAMIRHKHRNFKSEQDYIQFISECAGLPEDLR